MHPPLARMSSSATAASTSSPASVSKLVSGHWLHENLSRVRVLDCSWHLPIAKRDAKSEFLEEHIPGSQFFDIDTVKDMARTDLPHMLPPPEFFATTMDRFRIANGDHVVVYDSSGVGPACRVFWTFHTMGHSRVSVLNGGLPAWKALGYKTESSQNGPPDGAGAHTLPSSDRGVEVGRVRYVAHPEKSLVSNYTDVVLNIEELKASDGAKGKQIVDARPHARFTGEAPEFRPGLSSGHMPKAINVPSTEMTKVDATTGANMLKSPEEIRHAFEAAGVDLHRPIITTCGSGVTASVLYFALLNAGVPQKELTLFDGSWTEYALNPYSEIIKDHQ
ncbi:hypothetical protein GGI07_003519 [Coemansia sp. Benny D115]|nr:hypothetical protein GGI07_003519 [Coemansia sp. Benny D115]